MLAFAPDFGRLILTFHKIKNSAEAERATLALEVRVSSMPGAQKLKRLGRVSVLIRMRIKNVSSVLIVPCCN